MPATGFMEAAVSFPDLGEDWFRSHAINEARTYLASLDHMTRDEMLLGMGYVPASGQSAPRETAPRKTAPRRRRPAPKPAASRTTVDLGGDT